MKITTPHSPATTDNTDGYDAAGLAHLNAVYVEAWNALFADADLSGRDAAEHAKSLWDAIGNTDANLTLVLDAMGRQEG